MIERKSSFGKKDRLYRSLLAAILFSACVCLAQIAPSPNESKVSPNSWTLSYSFCCNIAGEGPHIKLTDKGVVQAHQRCFPASHAEVEEVSGLLKQLNLSGPPKPVHESAPIPDMPVERLVVVYGGQQYDLAGDYKPTAAIKRLHEVIYQLLAQDRKRVSESKSGTAPVPASIPCPSAVTP